jgi:cytochrome c-type biogenesis protein
LPLVPVYLASVAGSPILDAAAVKKRLLVFLHSLSFVLGFSLVFAALGAIAGLTAFAINPSLAVLTRVSGSLLVAFGLLMLLALKGPWLNFEKRLDPSRVKTSGYTRSFFIGAAFSLAWTGCATPILGGILALALNTATAWQGAYLLTIYSLGLGVPFLLLGLAFDSVAPFLKRLNRYSRAINIASGLLLIIIGVLTLMNRLSWFSSLLS